jgi:Ca-activated chloride channel family protein
MIHGRLIQTYDNPTGELIEAIYVFPLPDRAAVHSMEIRVGDRRIVSTVKEKQDAQRTYQRAREEGRKSALVAQQRPNLFTVSVANIGPGETVAVALEYYEEAGYVDGRFRLRFPLTYTPRFNPPAPAGSAARTFSGEQQVDAVVSTAAPAIDATDPGVPLAALRIHLRPGFPLREVESRSHAVEVEEIGDRLEVRTLPRRVPADRDFELSWSPELERVPRAAAFVEERLDGRYALVMIVPPIPGSEAGLGLPTETLFVIDVSGSMEGPSIRQARRALLASLDRLRPEDRFDILKFNEESEAFRDEFQHATAEVIEKARKWVGDLHAGGGTMIHPALMRGLEMLGGSRGSHEQRIIFLTDGAVGNEQELLGAIVERLGDTRLHTLGIGAAPNAWLMRKMAELGRGLCDFIADTREAEHRVEAFFERLDRPVMTDIEWSAEGFEIEEPYPRRLADLHAGQPLFLSARLAGADSVGTLRLGGYTRAGWFQASVAVTERSARESGIALRWARSRVESLMDSLREGADPGMVRDGVVDLGLRFHLVTPYTSLVAVDESVSTAGNPRRVRIASVLPAGGTDAPLRLAAGWVLFAIGACLAILRLVKYPK